MAKERAGFTIVELLIVIVVIAILATISIVAYSGIQQRARESHILSDLSSGAKQLYVYNAEKGNFPTTSQIVGSKIHMTFPGADGSDALICLDNTNMSGFVIYARMASDTTRQYKVTSESGPVKLSTPVSWVPSTTCTGTTPNAIWGSFSVTSS
jgi:prepilin-type N-terminal cleavage/methylation domain-containing protein